MTRLPAAWFLDRAIECTVAALVIGIPVVIVAQVVLAR